MPYDELKVMTEVLGHDLPSMDRALSRSLNDPEFRRRLLQDAKAAFAEAGVNFPEGVSVTCHEVSLNDRHFFLPPMVSDPVPVEAEAQNPAAKNRPAIAPNIAPVRGGVRPGVARPFMLGSNYPGPAPDRNEPDQRW